MVSKRKTKEQTAQVQGTNAVVQGTEAAVVQGTNAVVQGTSAVVQGTSANELAQDKPIEGTQETKSTVSEKPKAVRKKKEKILVEAKHIEAKVTVEDQKGHIEAPKEHIEDQKVIVNETNNIEDQKGHIEDQKGHDEATQQQSNNEDEENDDNKKQDKPKKRGRKPKGGKIVVTTQSHQDVIVSEPNIILHLKCKKQDLETPNDFLSLKYSPIIQNVENYQFDKNKGSELNFFIISDKNESLNTVDAKPLPSSPQQPQSQPQPQQITTCQSSTYDEVSSDTTCDKTIWKKIQKLAINLHNNNIMDKKSACFWCTCDFDNPPIYIPKYELNDSYHCYGCFCSPECATASLFKEPIDTSTKFERYHLINHIYCKIYNYTKNVKPAPEPYYTLNKYYGNLTIQEYRKMLKNDRLILIVDKPFTRSLPELHEDNDDFILNNKTIPNTMNKYKVKQKPLKSTLLSENFNMVASK